MRILVVSNDKYLLRKAELELSGIADVISGDSIYNADALIFDCDSGIETPSFSGTTVLLSRKDGRDGVYTLPLPLGKLAELVSSSVNKARLTLSDKDKSALLDGKKIKLTSHEYSLLSLLISGGKNYTSRDEISKKVWGGASDGLINIYIHYLREKLENSSEKIILSSRKYGYRINEKYIGEELL